MTATEVTYATDGSPKYIMEHASGRNDEVLTAAETLTAERMRGQCYFLSALAGFALTLPAPALGLRARFMVKTPPTSVGYTIVTNGSANIIVVSVNEVETDTTEDGPTDDNADLITLVANAALAGDFVDMHCDGTLWYATGQVRADGGMTTGTT